MRRSTEELKIEVIAELVLSLLWELSLQLVVEVLIELGLRHDWLLSRGRHHPMVAATGIVLLGGAAGMATSVLWPTRIIRTVALPGASLLVSPLLTGLVMDRYGRWREDRSGHRSSLATFWGGALFAFSMAVVRFVWVAM